MILNDLILFVADQCDIETHCKLRQTCRDFYQSIKPLTIEEKFYRHLSDIEYNLIQLIQLFRFWFSTNLKLTCTSCDSRALTIKFYVKDHLCEDIIVGLVDGMLYTDHHESASAFDCARFVELHPRRSKNVYGFDSGYRISFIQDSDSMKRSKRRNNLFYGFFRLMKFRQMCQYVHHKREIVDRLNSFYSNQ